MSTVTTSGAATAVVRAAYEAFLRRDVATILTMVADRVDWECVGSPGLPYAGRRTDKQGVAAFFAQVAQADDITVFEPREFIEAGDCVTVLGIEKASARETGQPYESEWVHVFTVVDGKVTRWRGFFNTAARYGI